MFGRNILTRIVRMSQTRSQIALNVTRALSAGKYPLKHDEKAGKVALQLDSDNQAWVEYERIDDKKVLLYHSEVPEVYGGKGIGKILAQEVFKFFDDRGDHMTITCPFLEGVRNKQTKK